jgi:hypothetical protein
METQGGAVMWKDVLKAMMDALRVATWQVAPRENDKRHPNGDAARR